MSQKQELEDKGFYISAEEKEEIEQTLTTIGDYQRLSSLLVWIGLTMVILHIGADIFFHVIGH